MVPDSHRTVGDDWLISGIEQLDASALDAV